MRPFLTDLWSRRPLPPAVRLAARFALGLAIGWLFHYMCYRFSLPVQPFIYAAF